MTDVPMEFPGLTVPPKVKRTQEVQRKRILSVSYESTDGDVTLAMLRDFVHQSRNQHRLPNWDPTTTVSIMPSEDGDTVTFELAVWENEVYEA